MTETPKPVAMKVTPIIDHSVRGLCTKTYDRHPKGCPNFGKCDRCPPKAPKFEDVYDLAHPVYAVVNSFPLGIHIRKLKATPKKDGTIRTDAEAECVLYWQGAARKQLKQCVEKLLSRLPKGYEATQCPEGMGVNVTATLAACGVDLEWPPRNIARQVALVGRLKGVTNG